MKKLTNEEIENLLPNYIKEKFNHTEYQFEEEEKSKYDYFESGFYHGMSLAWYNIYVLKMKPPKDVLELARECVELSGKVN